MIDERIWNLRFTIEVIVGFRTNINVVTAGLIFIQHLNQLYSSILSSFVTLLPTSTGHFILADFLTTALFRLTRSIRGLGHFGNDFLHVWRFGDAAFCPWRFLGRFFRAFWRTTTNCSRWRLVKRPKDAHWRATAGRATRARCVEPLLLESVLYKELAIRSAAHVRAQV